MQMDRNTSTEGKDTNNLSISKFAY